MYENSKAYDREKESHLMKSSEWGAVTYLTHSKYGRNGVEVSINNNGSNYITGYGNATGVLNSDYEYDTSNGMLASSTANISGIYDLNGGAYEYTSAYNKDYTVGGNYFGGAEGKTNASYSSVPVGEKVHFAFILQDAGGKSDKYTTAYSNIKTTSYGSPKVDEVSKTGDGIKEVWVSSDLAWFSDYTRFVNTNFPFFGRGGYYGDGASAGVFYSSDGNGAYNNALGFRVVLIP